MGAENAYFIAFSAFKSLIKKPWIDPFELHKGKLIKKDNTLKFLGFGWG